MDFIQLYNESNNKNTITENESNQQYLNLMEGLISQKTKYEIQLFHNYYDSDFCQNSKKLINTILPTYKWFYIKPDSIIFTARIGHSICYNKGKIFIFGGIDAEEVK